MSIVHGNDSGTGVEVSDETVWGTPEGTYFGVPIISESLHNEVDQVPVSPEFGGIGSQKAVELISPRCVGEIVMSPRLDGKAFNMILGHCFGEEKIVLNTYLDGSSGGNATGGNTHWYLPRNDWRSLTFRVWKAGTQGASGYWELFKGCIISSYRWQLDPDGLLTFAISVVGQVSTVANTSGSLGQEGGTKTPELRWLSQNSASFETGASLASRNIRGFTVNVDRQLVTDKSFMNTLGTTLQPGIGGNRVVTCTVQSLLEHDYVASGMPYKEWLDKTTSKCRIKIRDSERAGDGGSGFFYGMDIDFPQVKWTEADYSVKEAGSNQTTVSFQAIEGTPAAPSASALDIRCGTYVNDADDTDTYFTRVAGGVVQS